MLGDVILIPFVLLLLVGFKSANKNTQSGFYDDYFSVENTNIYKGIFAVVVVLYHLGMNMLKSSFLIVHVSGDFAVKFFFFVSGYGLFVQYKLKKSKGQNYLEGFLTKRLPKIIVPLLILCIPYCLVFNHFNEYYGDNILNLNTVISKFIENGYPIVLNSWYVIELIALYLIFYFSFKFIKNENKAIIFCAFLTVVLMAVLLLLSFEKKWDYFWFYSILAFPIGILFARYKNEIDEFLKKHFKLVCLIDYFIFIAIIICYFYLKNTCKNTDDIKAIFNIVAIPFFLLQIILLVMKFKPGFTKLWSWLGSISYELYLVHGLFYALFLYLKTLNPIIFSFGVMGLSILSAYIVHQIDQFIFKYYFKLIDKKR